MTRLPKLTADGANVISGEHVDRVMIAAAVTPEQAAQIVLAVNTFDQAREALSDMISLAEGFDDEDSWFGDQRQVGPRIEQAKAALSAMEATHE